MVHWCGAEYTIAVIFGQAALEAMPERHDGSHRSHHLIQRFICSLFSAAVFAVEGESRGID